MIDKGYVRELADILIEKDLGEIYVDGGSVRITAKNQTEAKEYVKQVIKSDDTKEILEKDENFYEVTAPIVGTYYKAPSPDAEDFLYVGKKVLKGDIIFIIETMKNMNEIPSPVDGEIVEILVEDKEMVDFGKPVLKLKRG